MSRLRHYYHVYADGDYKEIVSEHFSALRSSGLLAQLDHLHVGFVGSDQNIESARRRVARLVNRPFTSNRATSGWEQETQDVLYFDAVAAREPFLAFYAHTKGASSRTEINELWRKIMTRHTVREWKQAVAAFAPHIGAAGCFWAPFDKANTHFFAGTFWWARSEAIARIGPPERLNRYGAEAWIGEITRLPNPYAVMCLFDAPLEVHSLRQFARV